VHLSYLSFTASILMSFLFVTVVSAEGTPDGYPPAKESICDFESGAAYGLCNAYCEAMDCDSDTPNANDSACQKVSGKFTQVTGRDVPCAVPCPVLGTPDGDFTTFKRLISEPYLISRCALHPAWPPQDGYIVYEDPLNFTPSAAIWYSGTTFWAGDDSGQVPINDVQYEACRIKLNDAVNMSGVVCAQ